MSVQFILKSSTKKRLLSSNQTIVTTKTTTTATVITAAAVVKAVTEYKQQHHNQWAFLITKINFHARIIACAVSPTTNTLHYKAINAAWKWNWTFVCVLNEMCRGFGSVFPLRFDADLQNQPTCVCVCLYFFQFSLFWFNFK